MKRFPRAVPGALALMGLLIVSSEGCSLDQGVKPGAPVLKQLTILENGQAPTDITSDTEMCKTGVVAGDECQLVAEAAPVDAGDADGGVADGGGARAADPALCLLNAADWCRCQGDPAASPKGTWNCDPFSPISVVIATFDRLLDTTPFEADSGVPSDEIASLTAVPPAPTAVSPLVDYSSTGSDTSIIFKNFGPFFGNFRSYGPSIQVGSDPAMATSATITIQLNKANVRSKDGKPFVGVGLLADGSLKFKTAAFSASITTPVGEVPAAPAPADGGVDGGVADASADGGTDAPAVEPAPVVPADMDKVPVTIAFNNFIDGETIDAHITITENGKPFTAFTLDATMAPTITITPTTAWAAGKTYVVTVDPNTTDVLGTKLGANAPAPTTFMMTTAN